jgi:hypothetical protein
VRFGGRHLAQGERQQRQRAEPEGDAGRVQEQRYLTRPGRLQRRDMAGQRQAGAGEQRA